MRHRLTTCAEASARTHPSYRSERIEGLFLNVLFLKAGLACLLLLVCPCALMAQTSIAVREVTEFVFKKFGKEMADETSELFAKKLEGLVAKAGEESLEAVRKVGPRAVRWIEGAAADGPQAARLISKFGDGAEWVVSNASRRALAARVGDDAAEAMIKLGEPAEKIIELGGKAGAEAIQKLSSRNGRQLAMIAEDAATSKLAQNDALLKTIAKYGDRAMDFVWKNKGALAVGTALAAFVANPEPFLDGTKSIAEIAAQSTLEPIAKGIATGTNWTITIVVLSVLLVTYVIIKQWIVRPRSARRTSPPREGDLAP